MAVEHVTDHATRGPAELLEQFRDKALVSAWVQTFAEEIQAIEDALWQLLTERLIDTAVGAQLVVLAKIVDIERGSSSDTELRARIKAEIRLNRSEGTIEDILEILTLVLGSGGLLEITEYPPASMVVWVAPTSIPEVLADLIERGRAAGVGTALVYGSTAASGLFTLGATDTLVSSTTQGFASGDSLDTGTGGTFAGILEA